MLNETPLSGKRSQGRINWHEVESGQIVRVRGSSTTNLLATIRQRSERGRLFFTQYRELENGLLDVRCYAPPCPPEDALDYDADYDGSFERRLPAWAKQFSGHARRARSRRPSHSKYPWDEWQNGEVHEVDPADYGLDPFMLGVRLRDRVSTLNKRFDLAGEDALWVQIKDIEDEHVRFMFLPVSEITDDHPKRPLFDGEPTHWLYPRAGRSKDEMPRTLINVGEWSGEDDDLSLVKGDQPALDGPVLQARHWREGDDILFARVGLPQSRHVLTMLKAGYTWRNEFWSPHGRCIRIKNYFA